jgi:Rrf2 family iron-sulfur cluster assembly transcriptional regulator
MLIISTRSRYGLRALVEIVRCGHDKPLALSEIAAVEEVSTRYLEQIFGRLRSAGLVKGRRGPGGGYALARPASEITLLEIVQALESGVVSPSCLEDAPGCDGPPMTMETCKRKAKCMTRKLWAMLRDSCFRTLKTNTLEDLAWDRLREV